MLCSGYEPGVEGWKGQKYPLEPWSFLVEGDEGCIGPNVFMTNTKKLYTTCVATLGTCLTVGTIQLFISFY